MVTPLQPSVLRWPIELDSAGKFARCFDLNDVWQQRVATVISTRIGERAMRTDYGCAVASALFDPMRMLSPEQQVREALQKWLPRITVESVTMVTNGGKADIAVTFRTPDGALQEVTQTYQGSENA